MGNVTYDFYKNEYLGGSISETEWPAACREATVVLNRFRRLYRIASTGDSAENMAICAIAEVLVDDAAKRSVASTAIGSVSVSFDKPSKSVMRTAYEQASLYLDIYRGCD